jgi:hypothetical protein
MKKLRHLTENQEREVFNERLNGATGKDIVGKWGISTRHIKNIVLKFGGKIRKKKQWYSFNQEYFEKIDTEDKAYFLGFIVADGCINDRVNEITITQKETEILYKFKSYINSDGNIHTHKNRNISSFTITSKKTKKDLENLGITPRKSRVIKYPKIQENLQNHFMRGVFDGDGCITLRTDRRDGNQRGQFNICSGSKDFIKEFYDRLVKYCNLSGKNKIRNPIGTYYVVDWGGLSDIEKIHDFLYRDATVFLERKKETFDKVVSITKTKTKYRK